MLRLSLISRAGRPSPSLPTDDLLPGERARLATFGRDDVRERFVAGRELLRQLTDHPPDIDAAGRTLLPVGHANLSHSGDWLLAGASDRPIGVDVEVLRPRRGDLSALARQVHGDAQCARIERLIAAGDAPQALVQFLQAWTLKEAWLKCRGEGLNFARMRRLDFVDGPCPDGAVAVLPRAGVVLAVVLQTAAQGRALAMDDLPIDLAGEAVRWQLLESRALA